MEIRSHAYDAFTPLVRIICLNVFCLPSTESDTSISNKSSSQNPAICAILVQNLLYGIVYYSHLYYLPIYYQNVRGYSPLLSAALTIPFVAGQSIFSILSGQYISRTKRYGEIIWSGYALWTLGSGLVLLFSRTTPRWQIVIFLLIEGAGVGHGKQLSLNS